MNIYMRLGMLTFSSNQHIFSTHEMGFPMAPQPCKVLAAKGYPHVYQQGSLNKSQIMILLTASATVFYINLLIVYPGMNFQKTFMETFYKEFLTAIFGHSISG